MLMQISNPKSPSNVKSIASCAFHFSSAIAMIDRYLKIVNDKAKDLNMTTVHVRRMFSEAAAAESARSYPCVAIAATFEVTNAELRSCR